MKTPELITYRRNLPHWRIDGAVYLVTWRLAKSQPPLCSEDKTLVVNAIKYFEGERYDLPAYVVMDDHVHVLVYPLRDHSLQRILHSWKSFTANELRKLRQRGLPVWQEEYFDRIVRDEADLRQKARYILGNPLKRWPDAEEYLWVGLGSWDKCS